MRAPESEIEDIPKPRGLLAPKAPLLAIAPASPVTPGNEPCLMAPFPFPFKFDFATFTFAQFLGDLPMPFPSLGDDTFADSVVAGAVLEGPMVSSSESPPLGSVSSSFRDLDPEPITDTVE